MSAGHRARRFLAMSAPVYAGRKVN